MKEERQAKEKTEEMQRRKAKTEESRDGREVCSSAVSLVNKVCSAVGWIRHSPLLAQGVRERHDGEGLLMGHEGGLGESVA